MSHAFDASRNASGAPDELHHIGRHVKVGRRLLPGILAIPSRAAGIVLFSEASALGRHDGAEQHVARALYDAGLAVLLVDVAHVHAEDTREIEDTEVLAERVQLATQWIRGQDGVSSLRRGYFGSGQGGAAALIAASRNPGVIDAVVVHNTHIDRVRDELSTLEAPTRLIFEDGEMDLDARLRRDATAADVFNGRNEDVEELSRMARDWFTRHLAC